MHTTPHHSTPHDYRVYVSLLLELIILELIIHCKLILELIIHSPFTIFEQFSGSKISRCDHFVTAQKNPTTDLKNRHTFFFSKSWKKTKTKSAVLTG